MSRDVDLDPDDGLRVRGGSAQADIVAVLEDLESAASRLTAAGEELGRLHGELRACVAFQAPYLSALDSPGSFVAAEAQSLGALAGPRGLGPTASRVGDLGRDVRAAVLAYRSADAAASAAASAIDLGIGGLLGKILGPGSVLVLAGTALAASEVAQLPSSDAATQASAQLSEHAVGAVPGALAGMVPGSIGGRMPGMPTSMAGSAALLMSAMAGGRWLSERGTLRTRVSTPVADTTAPRRLSDIVARVAGVSPTARADPARTASPPGTVRVERVTSASGRRAWIAMVPGTQSWAMKAGPNPLDGTGAMKSEAGVRTAAGVLVGRALATAGARPGEPVLLAGHSQGGMVAANLAADPQFRSRFTVTHLLTMGSPIASVRMPDNVSVLSLEHYGDPVTKADGRTNPDRVTWTTVSARAAESGGGSSPHDLKAYAITAAHVEHSTDPRLQAWGEQLEPFLDGPGVTARAVEVTGERVGTG